MTVCATCQDTHRMSLDDREVACTFCPLPCHRCQLGPYCKTTPCQCGCHGNAEAVVIGPSPATDDDVALAIGLLTRMTQDQLKHVRAAVSARLAHLERAWR